MSSADNTFEAPSLETLGALLPAYAFELLIAQGGMGAVYKARQKSLDRDVAVKILPPVFSADAAFRKSFETEARAMARLNHPNLISVFDSGDLGEMLYIVMEYVPGKSLYHSSYGMRVDPAQAVELITGICRGLAHAHDNGILHRDIKPANILLNARAEPKIGDFGLALPADADGPGLIMGTPGYTAPEVMRHPEAADRRSDLYAVGVILYELLTGERQRPDSRPPSMVCGCDTTLDRIWQRATNTNPSLRYSDGHAFVGDLESWLKKHKPHQPHASASRPGHHAPPMRAPAARQAPPVIQRRSSGGFAWILVLAVVGAGGYFLWKNSTKTPPVVPTTVTTPVTTAPPVTVPGKVTPPPIRDTTSSAGPARDTTSTPGNGVKIEDELTPKARELISRSEAERAKQLNENIRLLANRLGHWVSSVPARQRGERNNEIERVKSNIQNWRVTSNGGSFSDEVEKLLDQATERQTAIDASYTTQVTKFRDLYVDKMREKVRLAEQGKQPQSANEFKRRVDAASDLDRWIQGLGGTGTVPPPEERTPQSRGAVDSVFGTSSPR